MTLASILAWFGRLKLGLRRVWAHLSAWLSRCGRFVLSYLERLGRNVLSWTGQGWLVVATIVIALLGYWQWRYSNVLELQKLWASPEMAARHQRLLDAHNCAYVPAAYGSAPDRPANPELAMVEPSRTYEGIETDLPAYVEFFGEVEMCIKMGLCDRSMACERFGPQAVNLEGYYGQYLDRLRRLTQENSYSGQFTRVAEMCGLDDQLRQQSSPAWNQEQRAEVDRLRQELKTKGSMAARRDQACDRMDPRRRQSQSRPAQ